MTTPSPLIKAIELGKSFAPVAERALKDPEIRQTLTDTAMQARGLYSQARRGSAGDLARDRRFQEEIGELVRAAAGTVDQARRPKKHRLRRAVLWIAALGGAAFVAMKFLRRNDDAVPAAPAAPVATSPNGVAQNPTEPGSQFAAKS